jgi:hypothetical protein
MKALNDMRSNLTSSLGLVKLERLVGKAGGLSQLASRNDYESEAAIRFGCKGLALQ